MRAGRQKKEKEKKTLHTRRKSTPGPNSWAAITDFRLQRKLAMCLYNIWTRAVAGPQA